MRTLVLLTAICCLGWTVKAQDTLRTVVVTGTKSEIPVEKSGKSIYKISREQIEANQGRTIADVLNEVPGVQIDGNFGAPGTNIDYRVRGAASRQTLILIDGIPFNDPTGISQTFDLRYLDLDQVESIEVLKGGLSTLYGTGAAAGVINIILKKPLESTLAGNANLEYGSFNTLKVGANASGKSGGLTYMISGNYDSSDGFSAARDQNDVGGFDDDGMENINFLGRLGYDFSDQFSVGLTAAVDDITYDYDAGAFTDNDAFAEQQQFRIGLTPRYTWSGGALKADLFYLNIDRLFNSPNFFDPASRFISEVAGDSYQADVVLNQNLSDQFKLIGGLNYQKFGYEQSAADDLEFNMVDPNATLIFENGSFNAQVGGRLNIHSEYGSNFVWDLNPSYLTDVGFAQLKVLSSYGTSFITPSLFQLLSPDFGNADLDPEESRSFEAGFELFADSKFQFGAVYFNRKDENAIGFTSFFDTDGNFTGGEYSNLEGSSSVDGIELNASYSFTSAVTLSGHYTYINSLTDQVTLFRVPQDKFGFILSVLPVDNLLVKLTHLHTGETTELAFPENATLDSYDLFDLFVSYEVRSFTISGSVNNVFDEEYEPILGFNSVERNYSFGLRYNF